MGDEESTGSEGDLPDDDVSESEGGEDIPAEESPSPEDETAEDEPSEPRESEETSQDEISPEELTEQTLDDESEEPTDESEETAPDSDEANVDTEETADEGLSPEELAEETLEGSPEESPESDLPEESAEADVTEDPPESSGEEPESETEDEDVSDEIEATDQTEQDTEEGEADLSPEELAERTLEEEEDQESDEPEELDDEEEAPAEKDEPDDTPEEDTESDEPDESEDSIDETEDDEAQEEPAEDDEGIEKEEGESIQDMLEREAEKAREEDEDGEEEEELPEGYVSVSELPEEEEAQVPQWLKTTGWVLLSVLISGIFVWFVAIPLWETFLMNQMLASVKAGNYETAESWTRLGLFLNGAFIKYDDRFVADYFDRLLANKKHDLFDRSYDSLDLDNPGPFVKQVRTEFLINEGRWSDALNAAEDLQKTVSTRAPGYLYHAKAQLELGNYESARADLKRAKQWMRENVEILRLERDLLMARQNYNEALKMANRLEIAIDEDPNYGLRVRDLVQLSKIHTSLEKYRVAEKTLERALELKQTHKGALKGLARRYVLSQRWQRAKPLIEGEEDRMQKGYLELFPYDAFGWWAGSEVMAATGDLNKSVRMILRADNLNPRNAEVKRVQGELYLEHFSQPDLAAKHLSKAREYGIKRLRFFNDLATAHYRAGNYKKSVEGFQLLQKELADTEPALIYNVGSAYLGAGELERAKTHIVKAFNQGYKNQDSFNQWGLILEKQGKTQDALAKYFEGIEWGEQNSAPVDRVRQNLNRVLEDQAAEPLSEWLSPVDRDLEIPYWRRL